MKTGKFSTCLVLVLLVVLAGCSPTKPKPVYSDSQVDMMIGQMVMVGFRGTQAGEDSEIIKEIKDLNLGGVILFDYDVNTQSLGRNIKSPEQVEKLISQLKSAAEYPLFVAVDQEGGRVCRLKESCGFKSMPSAQLLGSMNSTDMTYEYASENAKMLKSLGFNLNFAPDVDLNTNPENPVIGKKGRSYSDDPDVVAKHARAFIKAHDEQGVLCSLKHFPGHGSSTADSHEGFVDVTQTWQDIELKPYKKLIRQDIVDCVMTAHIFNANLDPNYPATLSDKILNGTLRGKYKFDGVIISDDMQMGAISQNFGFETAIERAVLGGVDIVLIANNCSYDPQAAYKTVNVIKSMVTDGKIPVSRIEESYKRIMKLKAKLQSE